MASAELELMVVLKEWSEKRSELVIRVRATGIDSDTGVSVLATGKNGFSEGIAEGVLLVFKLIPYVSCQEFAKQGILLTFREHWISFNI